MFTFNLLNSPSWTKAALIALSVFGVSACGGSSGSATTDTSAPSLTITPADNATNVSVKPNISLSFSETVTGVTTANVLLSKHTDGSSPIATTLSGSGSRYTVTPTAKLADNTTYYVVVKAVRIKDAANNPLGNTSQKTRFTTGKGEYAFTAWMGANDSTIDIEGSLPDGAELYSYRNSDCDIDDITACNQGQKLILNNQTITDTALTAKNTAYYKVRYQSKTAETNVSGSTNASDVFSGRYGHQVVEFNNKLWVIGGNDDNRKNDVYSSDDGIRWTQVLAHTATASSTQFSPRYGHQVVAFNNKLWVIGGKESYSSYKNDVWSSEDGITWTKVTDHAEFTPRAGHQLVEFKDKLWVIGGRSGSTTNYKNDVWYSADGSNWTQAAAHTSFSVRANHQVVVRNDKLWLIGGRNINQKNDVWSSSNGRDWTEKTASAAFSHRNKHQAVVFNNELWVIGGYDGNYNYKNDVWSSADGIRWTQITARAEFSVREMHQAVVFNNKLWMIGGDSAGSKKNDVWQSADGATWRKGYVGKLEMP